ncbi:neuronal acetylcholine receptor subunit alpha-10 isoform X2 [Cherax quadricarinatus]|uniref:neuronal acetylcholine receptor subunit alpha-10 isoform X2 n=1 Tax=Cherax quadricarinatus TaxID=27406 RepID=UPI00387E28BA
MGRITEQHCGVSESLMNSQHPGIHTHKPGEMSPQHPGIHTHKPGEMSSQRPGIHTHKPGEMSSQHPGINTHKPGEMSPQHPGINTHKPGEMSSQHPGIHTHKPGEMSPHHPLIHTTGLLYLILIILNVVVVVVGDEQEYRLTRYLMANYDSSVRPAANSSQALSVVFGVSLHSIIDVDEKNQILTTNCWLTQIWTDAHLTWNSTDFGGIQVIRVPYQRVWKPDIILYNNADGQYSAATINTNVIVTSAGKVTWLSHGIYRSSCDMNVEYFPFDIQSCKMMWASWTYDGYQLDLVKQMDSGDTSNYQSNGEFDLLEFTASKNITYYSCCPEPYPDITFTIKLRRRPMFYVFNLILPCVLINGIALLVFYVPSESGEKVTLGISALLSMTVFLMTIRESLPPTEKTPLISLYYGVTICLVSLASGMSVVTLNIHHRGGRGTEVPKVVKKLVLGGLSKFLFLQFHPLAHEDKRPHLNDLRPELGVRLDSISTEKFHMSDIDSVEFYNTSPRFIPRRHNATNYDSTPTPASTTMHTSDFEHHFIRVLNKVHQTIEKNELRLAEQDRKEATRVEWQQVALVFDRLLLACFLLSTVIATTSILFSSPHGP